MIYNTTPSIPKARVPETKKKPTQPSSLAMQRPSYVVVVKIDTLSAFLLSSAFVFFALALCQRDMRL